MANQQRHDYLYITEKPQISIIIPFYNEEECIESVCDEVFDAINKMYSIPCEVIVVNDGSNDNTSSLMNELVSKYKCFQVVHLTSNKGQSAALAAGINVSHGKVVATLDGDGQNDPYDLKLLLDEMKKRQVDMICGIRTKRADNMIRKISSRIANKIRATILKDNITDVGCSIRIFKRSCFDRIHFFRNAHRFLPALFIMSGYSVAETPVNHRPRIKGSSKYGHGIYSRLFAGIADLAGVYWLSKRNLNYNACEGKID